MAQILKDILEEAREQAHKEHPLRVVFDLDSTLFDVTPRIYRVFHDFVVEMSDAFPEETKKLRDFTLNKKDYGFDAVMSRLGLDQSSSEFLRSFHSHWLERFFSNPYLGHDEPYEGAVEYVTRLHDLGARIIYLTGRDIHRMAEGTFKTLLDAHFPVGLERTEVILKPHKDMDDPAFKSGILKRMPGPVWFFENEPENINRIIADRLPVRMVFFDSHHLGRSEPPSDMPTIDSYAF